MALKVSHAAVKDDRRLGKFVCSADLVRTRDPGVCLVMASCLVVRAEHLYAEDVIEYTAISPHFAPVELGDVIPRYSWTIHVQDPLRQLAIEAQPE